MLDVDTTNRPDRESYRPGNHEFYSTTSRPDYRPDHKPERRLTIAIIQMMMIIIIFSLYQTDPTQIGDQAIATQPPTTAIDLRPVMIDIRREDPTKRGKGTQPPPGMVTGQIDRKVDMIDTLLEDLMRRIGDIQQVVMKIIDLQLKVQLIG